MVATALPSIGGDFDAGLDATAWLVSALYIAAAIGQPAAGRLTDVIGPRRVFLGGQCLIVAAGALGTFASSLWLLVLARVLLGLGTSTGYPTALAVIRRRADESGVGVPAGVLGLLGVAGQVSLAIGPVAGGFLVASLGWRAVFGINVPLALLGLLLALRGLPHAAGAAAPGASLRRTLDVPGMLLFALGVTAALLGCTQLGSSGPSTIASLWAAAAVLGAGLVVRELRCTSPFLDLRMLARTPALAVTIVRYGASYVVLYSVLFGYTQWLEDGRGLDPQDAGLVLLPMLVVGILGTAHVSRRARIAGPMFFGSAALLVASLALLAVDAGTPIVALLVLGAVFGLPHGLNFATNQLALYRQAPAEQTGSASGLYRTGQYLGAVVASALIGVTFGSQATTHGLHTLAVALSATAALVLAGTVATRRWLPDAGPRDRPTEAPVP
jgi:MFS family permease